ncbi:DNA ligase [Sulfurospirillum sp. 1612]|uniref:DNA ligase n=1 Tax=Sulfurospirillum sp. 1612 TaxID=3094835 RepID=UPI002F94184C
MRKLLYLLFLPLLLLAGKPHLLLLETYHEDANISGWLMSEKLDGVRAYWNGKALISRGGQKFAAPSWFTKGFPPFAIDGELWSKRGDFANISGIVRRKHAHDGWRQLSYNIFEVPYQKCGLLQRLRVLQAYLKQHPHTHIKIIKQRICHNQNDLKHYLKTIEKKGGEGVVLRDPLAPYIAKRTHRALKVKSFLDDECRLIGYNQGKGKFAHKVGSFRCQMASGMIVNLGSGLSDYERMHPPKIGAILTFKYKSLTKNGKPRFPVFQRVRIPQKHQ